MTGLNILTTVIYLNCCCHPALEFIRTGDLL